MTIWIFHKTRALTRKYTFIYDQKKNLSLLHIIQLLNLRRISGRQVTVLSFFSRKKPRILYVVGCDNGFYMIGTSDMKELKPIQPLLFIVSLVQCIYRFPYLWSAWSHFLIFVERFFKNLILSFEGYCFRRRYSHCVKSAQIRSIYSVNLRIHPNTGKYGPEKTAYLGTFHAVFSFKSSNSPQFKSIFFIPNLLKFHNCWGKEKPLWKKHYDKLCNHIIVTQGFRVCNAIPKKSL